MNKKYFSQKGFTLVELLVAIIIFAILAGIIVSSASAVLKQSRNAKRQSDLGKYKSALESYHADQGFYPLYYHAPDTVQVLGIPQTQKRWEPDEFQTLNNCSGNPTVGCTVSRTYLTNGGVEPLLGSGPTGYTWNHHYCYHPYPSKQAKEANGCDVYPNTLAGSVPNACECDNISVKCQDYSLYANLEGLPSTLSCEDHHPPSGGGNIEINP